MKNKELLREIKERLQKVHGNRLRGVILYGSEARGEAAANSDIDVLVLLDGPIELGRDLRANIDALYSLTLDLERPIHAAPTDAVLYRAGACPLYRNVQKEGLPA